MKFITCTGYYGTGSSAVTDLISEYKDIHSMTDEEFRFLHDPDGIDDLYYHLVVNHNRHNSGHAVKRFLKNVDFWAGNMLSRKYSPFFKGRWKEMSYSYVDSLVDFTYRGWWVYDLIDRGTWFHFRKRILNFVLRKTLWRRNPERSYNSMRHEITYCAAPTHQDFVEITADYIERLFTVASGSENSTVMVDQLVPPSNVALYTRYFKDIRVIVVDRDPRDIYTLSKMSWRDGIVPTDNVYDFVKWFQYTRNHRKTEVYDTRTTMVVQFEDMVYRYLDTVSSIESFTGLKAGDHLFSYAFFNPLTSIHNTRVWEKYPELADEIRLIENELSQYLYDYSEIFHE